MTQLTAADLAHMTPDQIETARRNGRLATLLGTPPDETDLLDRATGTGQLTADDAAHLNRLGRHDLVADALAAGRFADLLTGKATTPTHP